MFQWGFCFSDGGGIGFSGEGAGFSKKIVKWGLGGDTPNAPPPLRGTVIYMYIVILFDVRYYSIIYY